jgi:hypothetical protein
MPPHQYPELDNLIGAWFHQDFDLDGDDTIEKIIASYRAVAPAEKQAMLRADIARFLSDARDVDAEFQERFNPQIIPTGFAPTTRAFLERIAELLND